MAVIPDRRAIYDFDWQGTLFWSASKQFSLPWVLLGVEKRQTFTW